MATVKPYRGRYVADYRDQHGRRRIETPKGHFETKALEKRAAQELLSKRLGEVHSGTYSASNHKLTFAELCDLFLPSKVRIRETTLSGYKDEIDCYLKPYFGNRKVNEITTFDMEQFRDEMAAGVPRLVREAREEKERELQKTKPNARLQPLRPGPRTTNRCLTRMVGIMGYGCRHKFVSGNPASRIEKLPVPEGESRVIESNVLTPPELRKAIDGATERWKPAIMFGVFTGARRAEIAGLKWADIDWNSRSARIERTWRRGKFYAPKTKASRRTVELPDEMMTELKRWRLRSPKSVEDLVFPTDQGGPMSGNDLLRSGFYPALSRAGLRRVRFHDLRHSFASNLLSMGWDVVTVSKLLGHANPQITLTIYAHALPKPRHGAADALEKAMREWSGNNLETSALGEAVAA